MSRFEQGAWAPLEGVLCKTPIIVTADTGTGEDVKRLNAGYLVDFDNNEMLAQTIIDILNDCKYKNFNTWGAGLYYWKPINECKS